jgi:hypothetical protein
MPAVLHVPEQGTLELNKKGLFDWRMAQYQTLLAIFNLEVYPVISLAAQVLHGGKLRVKLSLSLHQ